MEDTSMNKKIVTLCLAAALAVTPFAVFAENTNPDVVPISELTPATPVGEDSTVPVEKQSAYVQHTLTVKVVTTQEDGSVFIEAEDAEKQPAHINLDKDFALSFDNEGKKVEVKDIKADDTVRIFLAGNSPMLAIYPPRYTPAVLIVNKEDSPSNVNVDTYTMDKDAQRLTNAENSLALNISDETVIVDEAGNKVAKEELDGKDLCVFYTIATFSIPAQTPPQKIVVLDKEIAEVPDNTDDNMQQEPEVVITGNMVINGKALQEEIVDVEGTQMVPVRTIAEAMDLEVKWDDALKAVSVGTIPMGVNFKVGVDAYNKARMTPFTFGQAPVTIVREGTGVTYVPVAFFTEVIGAEISTQDGKTVIDFK